MHNVVMFFFYRLCFESDTNVEVVFVCCIVNLKMLLHQNSSQGVSGFSPEELSPLVLRMQLLRVALPFGEPFCLQNSEETLQTSLVFMWYGIETTMPQIMVHV